MTRLSKPAAAALLALTLSIATPAFAAQSRDGGGDSGSWGTRIIRVVKHMIHHLLPGSMDDIIGTTPPKP